MSSAGETNATGESDEALLAAARAGDPGALERLLERHEAQVYRFGLRMCRDQEDAKDVLQDTLLAMARGIRDFRGASSLSTWLYSVARSFCIKKRRVGKYDPDERARTSTSSHEAEQIRDPARAPDEALAAGEIGDAIERAIQALDPAQRDVLVLRDAEGLTAPEVAEVLGISVQAVKSRLHRARLAVRDHVAPLLGVPESPRVASCPDVSTLFSRHLEGEISSELCAEMERHVEGCPRCRGACDSLRQTLALCKTTPTAEVPPALQASIRAALRGLAT